MINLRFHHLLCFLGFRGLGYSNEFVENFRDVYQKVFEENQKIKLIESPDDICKKCPRLVSSTCVSEQKVKEFDEKLKRFLFKNGVCNFEMVQPAEIYRVIKKLSICEFENICKSCEWFSLGYCKEGLLKLKRKKDLQP